MTMRYLYSTFLTFVLLTPLIALPEVLPNPSFEIPDPVRSDAPLGWVKSPADADGIWDTTVAKDGGRSLRIDSSATGSVSGSIWITEDRIPAAPGQTFRLTGWIKTADAWGDNEIAFSWFDARGKWLKTDRSPSVNGTHDWTLVTLTATAPSTAASFRVTAGRKYRTESGSSWFDHFSLSPAVPSASTEPPRAAPPVAIAPLVPFPGSDIPRLPPVQVDTSRHPPSAAPVVDDREWNILPRASHVWLPVDLPDTAAGGDDGLVIPVPSPAGAGWQTRASFPVHPSNHYELSALLSLDDALGNTHLAILWLDSSGREIKRATSSPLNGREHNLLLALQASAPANASSARIAFLRRTRVDAIPGAGASICHQIVFRDCTLSAPLPTNLIANGSVEDLAPGATPPAPSSWHRLNPEQALLELETRMPYDGSHSLSIANSLGHDTGWASDPFPVTGDADYQLALRLRLENTANVRITVEWFDAAAHSLAVTESAPGPELWQDWRPFRLLLRSPARASTARVMVTQSKSSGRSAFDDFRFTPR
ncbi:MAG: hypothetical protein WC205_12575 [Opitutaceae bacterium]|jgi:hypothetical protein